MTLSLILACMWAVIANVLAMTPSRDNHWRNAYILIAIGIPILGYVTLILGPVWGLVVMAAGASVLRFPLIRAARHLRDSIKPPREYEP